MGERLELLEIFPLLEEFIKEVQGAAALAPGPHQEHVRRTKELINGSRDIAHVVTVLLKEEIHELQDAIHASLILHFCKETQQCLVYLGLFEIFDYLLQCLYNLFIRLFSLRVSFRVSLVIILSLRLHLQSFWLHLLFDCRWIGQKIIFQEMYLVLDLGYL